MQQPEKEHERIQVTKPYYEYDYNRIRKYSLVYKSIKAIIINMKNFINKFLL